MNSNPSLYAEIVQYEQTNNIFLVQQNGQERFRVSFLNSIIHKFYAVSSGYILVFQTHADIAQENGNICLVSLSGRISWWVEKRNESSYSALFVATRLENGFLIAYDGSFNYWININNGKIYKREFVK